VTFSSQFSTRLLPLDLKTLHDGSFFCASVALIIVEENWSLIVIKRAENIKDPWSGHYGFPGGMIENNESSYDAVTRECFEEIGLSLFQKDCLGKLPPYKISFIKNAKVIPYVFFIKNKPKLKLDSFEVESVLFFSLKNLFERENLSYCDFLTSQGIINRPALTYQNHMLWGISLAILNQLLACWQGLKTPWGDRIQPFNLS